MERMSELEENDICMDICKWCSNYRNFGGVHYSGGVAKYYDDWRCTHGLTPRTFRCPRHEDYTLEVFHDDQNH